MTSYLLNGREGQDRAGKEERKHETSTYQISDIRYPMGGDPGSKEAKEPPRFSRR